MANKVLQFYTLFFGRLKPRDSFKSTRIFTSIVIYSTTALGDLMFNTPAIRAIKNRYPHAFITLVSSHKNKGLVANSRYFDDVIYWDEKVRDILGVIKALRKNQPELAIILHAKPPYDVISAVLAGCEYVVKDIYGDQPSGIEPWLAHYILGFSGHLIQRKLNLLEFLGCDSSNKEMFIPVDFPLIEKDPGKITIGFQMGASETFRCWPVPKFVALAKSLLALGPQYEVVLIGTQKEKDHEQAFLAALSASEKQRVISYIAKSSLPQLLGIIKNMDVLVTGDTGPLHLAVALKTRTVSLFGTAVPKYTGPYQDPQLHEIMWVADEMESMNATASEQPLDIISAEDVQQRLLKLLPTN
ncbi:glycosyltransferase family 9 protein [Rouxiella aceris]|uniref:glycosyltransferase family 9 protein n=1 Tax=Rouxiella aceris TaxID=2703884 RepID=UPI002852AE4E|nr:glycosyltransferase family 9 protein [Rouxiella aceris]